MLNFNLYCEVQLFSFFIPNYAQLQEESIFFLHFLSPVHKVFLVFSQIRHPLRFYTGGPQLHLPSLCRPKAMFLHETFRTKLLGLRPDLKPPQALSFQLYLHFEFSLHFWHLGSPGLSDSGMPLSLLDFCPQIRCVHSKGGSRSPLYQLWQQCC